MNIVLIGYRCSGKSLVGRMLAESRGFPHVDTDRVLEKQAGTTISAYVAEKGWEAFRLLEKMVIRSVSSQDHQVISTGGGAVLDWENVRHLRQNGWVAWLRASASVVRIRMRKDAISGRDRPGLMETDPLSEIEKVLEERTPIYQRSCHFAVNTDSLTPEQVRQKVLQASPNLFTRPCPDLVTHHGSPIKAVSHAR